MAALGMVWPRDSDQRKMHELKWETDDEDHRGRDMLDANSI